MGPKRTPVKKLVMDDPEDKEVPPRESLLTEAERAQIHDKVSQDFMRFMQMRKKKSESQATTSSVQAYETGMLLR